MTTTFLKKYYDDFIRFISSNSKYSDFLFLTETKGQSKIIRTHITKSLQNDGDAAALISNRTKTKPQKYSFEQVCGLVKECAEHYNKQFSSNRTSVEDLKPGHEYKRIMINAAAHNFDNGHDMFFVNDPNAKFEYFIWIQHKDSGNRYAFEIVGNHYKYQSEKDKDKLNLKNYNWAVEATTDPTKKVLFFLETKPSTFKYVGVFNCLNVTKYPTENDAIIEIAPADDVSIYSVADLNEQKIKKEHEENEKLSLDELEKKAKEVSAKNEKKPKSRKTSVTNSYPRSETIRQYIIRKANGVCHDCGKHVGPGKNNIPELQCHHVIPLSAGGKDTIKNCVALCPNCHRHRHIYELKKE